MSSTRLVSDVSKKQRSRLDRALVVTLVSGVALLLLIVLVFSIANGSRQITTNATALHYADETLRAATVTRAQVGLAVYLSAVDQAFGTYSGTAIELSVSEADIALADMITGSVALEAAGLLSGDGVVVMVESFGETAANIIDLLSTRDIDGAQFLATTLDTEFLTLVSGLEEVNEHER